MTPHSVQTRIDIPVGGMVFDALASGPADGELVLLLHGFPQSAEQWTPQLDALVDVARIAGRP